MILIVFLLLVDLALDRLGRSPASTSPTSAKEPHGRPQSALEATATPRGLATRTIAAASPTAVTARSRIGLLYSSHEHHDRTAAAVAPGRYKVQFTATADLREKLERLQSLMGGTATAGDLAAVIEAAVTEKLQRLEARRGARVAKPRKTLRETDTRPRARHVPAAVRRALRERDRGQCRFVGRDGRRCSERRHLEFHHRHPFGMGGDHAVDNVQLMCRTHNRYVGEAGYGKSHYRPARGEQVTVPSP